MVCPNLSNPTYKSIKSQYGEFAQYVASSLFDSPQFQEWKGDDEIPQVNNNKSELGNAKIIFGHPGLGKSYVRNSNSNVIDFDEDYKTKINTKYNLPLGFKARNEWRTTHEAEWKNEIRSLWKEAVDESKKTGKLLMASDMMLLREFESDFDKIVTVSENTFINRAKQRNDYTQGETESWKDNLDKTINGVTDKSKILTTDKYLSDLMNSGLQILSNSGSTFPISRYFDDVLAQVEQSGSIDSRYYEKVDGQLRFKSTLDKLSTEEAQTTSILEKVNIPLTTSELNKQIQERVEAARNQATESQQKTLDILSANNKKITFTSSDHTYSDGIVNYTPTTTAIGSTFNGDSSKFQNSRIWGSQVDSLLSNAVRGEEFEPTPNLSKKTREQVTTYFNQLVKELTKDGTKLITQSILSDSDSQIAGSADLILLHPDGRISIYDLKTSMTSTLDKKYDKQWKGEGGLLRSKRETHAAQLGVYKALAEKMGLEVVDLKVVPVKLDTTGDQVDSVETEPLIEVKDPQKYVQDLLARRKLNIENGSKSQKDYTTLLNSLKVLLQEKIDKIQQSLVHKSGASSKRLGELKNLQNLLIGVDQIGEISKVIDAIHKELVGTDTRSGYAQKFDQLIQNVDASLATDDIGVIRESLKRLNTYKEYVDDYKDLDKYLEIYANDVNSTIKGEKDSPIEKLRGIATIRVAMQQAYYKATRPLIAASLSKEISKSANDAALTFLDSKQKLLALAEQADKEGKTEKANSFREKYYKQKEVFEKLYTDEAKILANLERTTSDMGMLEFLSGTLSNSSDSILGLFAKKIKATYARIDEFMFGFQHEAVAQFEKFKKATKRNNDRPQDFNKGIYETVRVFSKSDSGEWTSHEEMHFVQEIDQSKWNTAIHTMFGEANQIQDEEERGKHIANWFAANTIPRSQQEIDEIRKEKYLELFEGYITEREHTEWEEKNMRTWNGSTTYMRELAQPNPSIYSNKNYEELQKNPALKEYHSYLLNAYKTAQAKYPVSKRMGTRLPSINKSTEDLVREKGGLKKVGQNLKDYLLSTYQDDDRYKSGSIVPTYFTQFMPAENVSLDLLGSIVKFTQAAQTYEAIAGNSTDVGLDTEAKSLLNVVEEREIEKVDSKTKVVMKDAARKLGFTDAEIEKKGGLYAAFLKHFIDQNLYGVGEDKILLSIPEVSIAGKKFGGGKIDTAKATNTFISLASWPALGGPFTILKAVANKLNAEANTLIEGFGKQYLSQGDWVKGKAIYDKWVVKSMLSDYASPLPTSLEGQLMEWFSPIQGEFRDKVGDDLSWSGFKRAFVPGSWFFLQKAGEHSAQMSMFFGILYNKKVTRKIPGTIATQSIRLKDAYELDSHGKLRLKEGVEFSDRDKDEFVNRIHAINKGLHGVYNKMDKSVAQKQAIGRLAFMYRKFLVPAVKRRWGSIRMDQELGDTVEGFHRTLMNTLINDHKELINFYLGRSNKLTPMEQANIRRATTELALVACLTAIIAAMTAIKKKDPKLKKNKDGVFSYANAFNSTLYQAMRIHSEFQFFLPLVGMGDQLRIFTSPSAANSTLQKLFNFSRQIFSPFETYEQSSQYHKKGESKLAASVSSLLGLNGLDAKRAQEQFNKLY